MASKMRTYAENELGVHEVYVEAQSANGELIGYHSNLLEAKDMRRRLTEEIADREAIIWRELRDKHPELSATALDGKAKLERRTDPTLQDLRRGLQEAQSTEDMHEQSIKACQNRISIATARMIQLGGYFPFLFEIMKAEAVAPVTKP
jgi:hypothetical protein